MDWRHTNWQTRLALDWLMDAPETVSNWRAHAATRDVSTVANDLAIALVSEISALPESWARDAAMMAAQSIDWQVLASAVTDEGLANVARKDDRNLHGARAGASLRIVDHRLSGKLSVPENWFAYQMTDLSRESVCRLFSKQGNP